MEDRPGMRPSRVLPEAVEQEVMRLYRRWVHALFGACTVIWIVLWATTEAGTEGWLSPLPLAITWAFVWAVNAVAIPRLAVTHYRCLHAYGKVQKGRFVKKRWLVGFGLPTVTVELGGTEPRRPLRQQCIALPSQLRGLSSGDEVTVLCSRDWRRARAPARWACLSVGQQGATRDGGAASGEWRTVQADVAGAVGEVVSILEVELRRSRHATLTLGCAFALGVFILLLSSPLTGLAVGLGVWLMCGASQWATERTAVRSAVRRFDSAFRPGTSARAAALDLMEQVGKCGAAQRLLLRQLQRKR
jgi:hypothetical protein